MSISYTRLYAWLLFWFCMFQLQGQSDIFSESKFSLNFNSSGNYKGNFALGARFYTLDNTNHFNQQLIELSHFSTLKLNNKLSMSIGALYRQRDWFEDRDNEFRITEQFNIKSVLNQWRFGHRIRAEQRINNTRTVHRFRYRLAFDTPLNGLKLDLKEFYIVASTEFLWSIAKAVAPRLDQRVTTQLGYFYSKNMKLQLGFQYRTNGLIGTSSQNGFILSSVIYNL